ncbi:hypothetical protein EPUS_07335 [Endocarpon pusillum Z07020]|uniref:Uncharacterized protein n=1 Tax=Endocarpon pusillum (strain Z07020 / HMAS-L-300199) TaxID=1263415 RepID=U1HZU4_ENDPU|nr:uncharacterized protein EPUS_07335 [Endocarpon pusillum Z07020]ERF76455.1 hypothetical protein EPUS_07335 [Endocarpon pusillum Z07020]
MILSSNTKTLTGVIAVFVLSCTSLVVGQSVSGNDAIADSHGLTYVYEEFTVSPLSECLILCKLLSLPSAGILGFDKVQQKTDAITNSLSTQSYNNNNTDAQSLVDQYVNITNIQLEGLGTSNLQVQLEDATQYGVAEAVHVLVLEIRRFFFSLISQKNSFTRDQRVVLSDTVLAQNLIVDDFLQRAPAYLGKVLEILERDLAVIRQSYASTSNELLAVEARRAR